MTDTPTEDGYTVFDLPPNPMACQTLTNEDSQRLKDHGLSQWNDWHKTCLTCTKQGVFKAREGTQIKRYKCDCRTQWMLYRWMLNAGIGLRYQRLSWADATGASKEGLREVVAYEQNATARIPSGMGLTLGSPDTGTGKSLLIVLLAKSMLAAGHDVYFTQFNDMLDAFSSGWRNEEDRRWFQRRVRNAGVLFVDDIGREHKGRAEVAEAMFDTVIRHRVASSMPTFITTNYTEPDMLQGLGGNVLSLLSEVNKYVPCPGADFRPTARQRTITDAEQGISRPLVVA